MDAFLARLSYQATSYAIRSCIALTSTYVIQQGSRLLKTVDDEPLRAELDVLQRRLAHKIELISPILETIEFRYTRGNSALEVVVRTAHELQEDIDALGKRLEGAALFRERPDDGGKHSFASPQERAELLAIIVDMKHLITEINDTVPLINLWVSAIGGIQSRPTAFSPSRLLQASMLVNIGDTQYIIDASRPMQIGPDFTLSLYMLFQGHAFAGGEAYGIEDGQRKPIWKEAIHKARVRLYRVPSKPDHRKADGPDNGGWSIGYKYELQIIEDLDDGRLHTFESGHMGPTAFDGVVLAGVRQIMPIGQISKMFYADVGRILNINNEDGASSNPVLLLKRDTQTLSPGASIFADGEQGAPQNSLDHIGTQCMVGRTVTAANPQDEINRQLREESEAVEGSFEGHKSHDISVQHPEPKERCQWTLPHDLDPEWLALEVYDVNDCESSTDEEETAFTPDGDDVPLPGKARRRQITSRASIDNNLMAQLQRMNLASSSLPSSRSSSFGSRTASHGSASLELSRPRPQASSSLSPNMMEQSPFGAIKTSLSLLEMLLRLTSLQEFEQTTHLAIPDHVLQFYLDESASESGLHGKERWAARAEAARKVGFDPYSDSPSGSL